MPDETLSRADIAEVISKELEEISLRREGKDPNGAKDPSKGEAAAAGARNASQGEADAEKNASGQEAAAEKDPCQEEKDPLEKVFQACHEKRLFGVSISGGGIRSATFALGVLQGLAKKELLQVADYVSTVSGGGYIGSWLQGVLKGDEKFCRADDPYEPLKREVPKPARQDPITFLRKFSNYLAPRHGFSLDTLLIPMIWSRNMLLNLAIFLAAFLAAFLPAFLPGAAFLEAIESSSRCAFVVMLLLAFGAGLITVFFMAKHLRTVSLREFSSGSTERASAPGQGAQTVAKRVLLPIFVGTILMTFAVFSAGAPQTTTHEATVASVVGALVSGDAFQPGHSELGIAISFTGAFLFLFVLFYFLQRGGGFIDCYQAQRKSSAGRVDLNYGTMGDLVEVVKLDAATAQKFVDGRPYRSKRDLLKRNIVDQAKYTEIQDGIVDRTSLAMFHVVWMSVASAALTLVLLHLITMLFRNWRGSMTSPLEIAFWGHGVLAWAPPLYMLALMSGIVLQIGLMGKDFPDASREWLARAGTLFWIACAGWAGYFSLVLFTPYAIASGWEEHKASIISAATAWLGSTVAAVLAGKSPKSAGPKTDDQKTSTTLDLIARYGPFVVIAGFLVLLAFFTQWLFHLRVAAAACSCDPTAGAVFHAQGWKWIYWTSFSGALGACWWWPLVLFAAAVAIFTIMSWRVNINEFSMHHFYKNRLVRCYMGATAGEKRKPDWFTGFDPKDDIPLKELRWEECRKWWEECTKRWEERREQWKERQKRHPDSKEPFNEPRPRAPYPIVNATLNVTAGTDLATQERKGLSWIFTPWYSGFFPSRSDQDREERTETKQQAVQQSKTYALSDELGSGIALGTAMAISGAAANPNWGYHSSPQTAFLLTLFNVRLGWWMGNPTDDKAFRRPGPGVALKWLLRELFGSVDESSAYLSISDGGHFENLGLYELVRRRCRHIIAIDGEADTDYRFEGLGGAVRKCRDDFGINIEVNPRPIQLKNGLSVAHCVVGRIYYPEKELDEKGKPKPREGWLFYIKSSMTGDEPADVEEYRRENPDFPQQSTLDQFFSESQFESYRMLGYHAVNTALDFYKPEEAGGGKDTDERDKLFDRLAARWEVPPNAPEGAFTRHAEAYSKLMDRVADKPSLMALSGEMGEGFPDGKRSKEEIERFYFWLDLIQLMEDIFVDLKLADARKWNHPSYAGWKRLFEYWAKQDGLKNVWMGTQGQEGQKLNYGKAFRYFLDGLIG